MKTLAERTEALSPAKRSLLEKLLGRQTGPSAARAIAPRTSQRPAPLSFSQERLWFLDQLEPQNPFYNVSAAVRLKGPLDSQVLQRCLLETVRRHEILRTTFTAVDGHPVQLVHAQSRFPLKQVDLRRLPAHQREAEAERLAQDEAQRPFDLTKGPLLRGSLVRLAEGEHVLVLVMHHIICDGWSMGVLRQEVAALYDALASGRPSPLPTPQVQYADYAVWQRDWFQGQVLAGQAEYWRSRLGDGPPPLELPTDRIRPAVQTYRGRSFSRRLPPALAQSLEGLARDENVTLFMVLLAAFDVLLARYTRHVDICVGSPIANRRRTELEHMIGFFVNTLVLRADLTGDPSFRRLLAQIREVTLGAYAHQDMPFEKLVDLIEPKRDLSRSPVFQVMFVLQNTPPATTDAAGVSITDIDLGVGQGAAFDLTLNVSQGRDDLNLLLVYNSDLFDESTARRMLESYEALLGGVLVDLDGPISRLPLVSAEERRLQLVDWNDTHTEYPADLCLHQLFEAQVARTPDAAAVVCREQTLTYRQLDVRANRLANHLRKLGAGPGVLVGFCLDRSPDLLVTLLGILKAGAAYVPLDPSYPQARLAYMIKDAGLDLVITHNGLAQDLPTNGLKVICVGRDREIIAGQDAVLCHSGVSPDNLAYVIYTSGSTGRPKAVEVRHRGLVNHAVHLAARQDLVPGDRVLQYLSPSFDASAEEIYPALAAGAAVVLHPAPGDLTGRDVLDFSRQQSINVLHLPPPIWHQIVDVLVSEGPSGFGHLKTFLTGGDSLATEKLRKWCEFLGDRVKFLHCYGVTEASITTTIFEAPARVDISDQAKIPIGRPIANHRVYLLDENMQPVPVGVFGEMFIGGVGVAQGYRNRPELSAEKFLPDPFGSHPAARLYRTGDCARWLPDGTIEFLGRMDLQVKIRGFRVEPGEVEAALAEHETVRDAVVIVREDQPGKMRLVAYVVPAAGHSIAISQLRRFLGKKLPDHMIPSFFVKLDHVPMTPGGKIDRTALPAPGTSRPALDQEYVPPQTPVQRQLADIWAGVLDIDRVGVRDNFFDLGGDSILSIQMVSRARAQGIQITPKQLFLHQTIAELAGMAGTGPKVVAEQGLVTGPVPLVPVQRQWLATDPPEPNHFNQAVLLELKAGLTLDLIRKAIRRIVEHHDALRTRLVLDQGRWQQTVAPREEAALVQTVDLSELPSEKHSATIEETAVKIQTGLDLAEGPLVRCAFFQMGEGRPACLLIVIHHLAVDGVSWRILLEDLQLHLNSLAAGRPAKSLPKTTSFKYWAERLAEYAQRAEPADEAEFWLAASAEQPPPLPRDMAIGENLGRTAKTVTCPLDAHQTQTLLHQVPQAYHTRINDVLLAALVQAVAAWTGLRSLLVNLEGHGREELFDDVDLSRTVGWFTAIYPVTLELPPTDGPGQALTAVKEQLRQIPSGGIGYGLLRWTRTDDRVQNGLRDQPRPEISFNYLGQFDQLRDEQSLFSAAEGSVGPTESPHARRPHLVDVIARVQDGRLLVDWIYSQAVHQPSTIERLAAEFIQSLGELIEHCVSPDAGGFTPSDFPLADVDQDDLSRLSDLLDHVDEGDPTA